MPIFQIKPLYLQIYLEYLEKAEYLYHQAVYWHVYLHVFRCHLHPFDAVFMDLGRRVHRERRGIRGDVQAAVLHLGHLRPDGASIGDSAFFFDVLRQPRRIL